MKDELLEELAYLGTANGIIQHEFNGILSSLRNNFKIIENSPEENHQERLRNMKISFDIFDGYISSFTFF